MIYCDKSPSPFTNGRQGILPATVHGGVSMSDDSIQFPPEKTGRDWVTHTGGRFSNRRTCCWKV